MSDHWKNLRNSFFTGLLIVLPVGATLGLIWWVVRLVTAWLPEQFTGPQYRVLAVLFLVLLTIFVGWLTRKVAGKRMIDVVEALIMQTPLMNKIYPFIKEISETLLSGRKTMFQRVVLIEFPRAGIYAIGFVTSETDGEAQEKTTKRVVNVFVPTTPNPTSGYLVLVPVDQVTDLEMTVAEGMKMVISGGAVVPPYLPKPKVPGTGVPAIRLMETERAEAIVLRVQPATETSLLVTWLTREHGKLKTLAKGARRPKSPMRGKINLFYEDEIVFLRSRRSDLHLLHECFLENPHKNLRATVETLAAASFACELVDSVTEVEDPNPVLYGLLSAVLGQLEKRPETVPLIWFELQVLNVTGWRPAFAGEGGTAKVLRSLAGTSAAGVQRVRLTADQARAAQEALCRFREQELGRSLRTQKLLWKKIER